MELQEIEIIIDADGNVVIKTHGLKGIECLEATQELEAALGGQVANRELTAEAYEGKVQLSEQITTRTS